MLCFCLLLLYRAEDKRDDDSPRALCLQIVCLSDLFMEREQFEFMLDILLGVSKSHPTEDELVNQYLVVGLAKATAVVGAVSILSDHQVL